MIVIKLLWLIILLNPFTLLATEGKDLIEVENHALGYRVKFYLEKFEMEGRQVIYAGKPLFQYLAPTNEKQEKQWTKNRLNTYYGSQRHFYKALVTDNLRKEDKVNNYLHSTHQIIYDLFNPAWLKQQLFSLHPMEFPLS